MHVLQEKKKIGIINSDTSDRRVFNVAKYTPPGSRHRDGTMETLVK
jgi:hypothetical protein